MWVGCVVGRVGDRCGWCMLWVGVGVLRCRYGLVVCIGGVCCGC